MTKLSHLASELLAHILKLSTEGESAKEQQRARLSFGLVSRACFLATADSTDFYVAGPKQAEALVSKLKDERSRMAHEERKARIGRTTRASTLRIMRVSNVRRLRVSLDDSRTVKSLVQILHTIAESLSVLEIGTTFRLLIPLTHLEILHLDVMTVDKSDWPNTELALPHLRELIAGRSPSLRTMKALTGSATRLSTLDLSLRSTDCFPDLMPLVSTLSYFCWAPERQPLDEGARDNVLKLLGAMTSLKSAVLPIWTLGDPRAFDNDMAIYDHAHYYRGDWDRWDLPPADRTVFDVLATLPLLHSVRLIADIGMLEAADVMDFMKTLPSLRDLVVYSPRSSRRSGWSHDLIERVRAAGEEAGVAFVYQGDNGLD
ncbi:hypothetical protein RQP46_008793 [Phenoliferia psychrophenolica]